MGRAAQFWIMLFAAFPALDPASEHYDQGVQGSDLVQWMGENAEDIRKAIDSRCVVGDVPFTPGPWHARLDKMVRGYDSLRDFLRNKGVHPIN